MARRVNARRQVALPIDGRSDLMTKEIRGGKGQSLAVMQQLGLRVPPAFTVSTTVMRAYCETGRLPNRLRHQLEREMKGLEQKTGKKFGDCENPLLVSVRSGAATSMPGMMDTILNLGMNESVRNGFAKRSDAAFGEELYQRFAEGWNEIALNEPIPDDVWEQLERAILMVLRSWDNPRARMYREHHGISHALGTALNVQAMVYGNRDDRSGTGVVFSHDVNTGTRGLSGEYLSCAQGEDVVSGKYTPQPISTLLDQNPQVYGELVRAVELLERYERTMVEVEFTIESGVLYMLQHRPAKASLEARITSLVHDVWAKRRTHEEAIALIAPSELEVLAAGRQFEPEAWQQALASDSVIRGIAASPGVATGWAVFSSEEAVERAGRGERVILVRPDTSPDDLPGMLVADGIITLTGGATCHAAVVARAEGKPAIVGAGRLPEESFGPLVSMSGSEGYAVSGVIPVREATLKKEVSLFKRWSALTFPAPRFDYSWREKNTSVLECMYHVYMLELLAHEAKGKKHGQAVEKLRCEWYLKTAELFGCYLVHAVAAELRHVTHEDINQEFPVSEGDEYYGYTLEWARLATMEVICGYLRQAATAFRKNHTNGSAYGGNKWAVIAETALDFFEGRVSHIVFVDRVFDLEHNTGHVFNKHTRMLDYHDLSSRAFTRFLNAKKVAKSAHELNDHWSEEMMGMGYINIDSIDTRLVGFMQL